MLNPLSQDRSAIGDKPRIYRKRKNSTHHDDDGKQQETPPLSKIRKHSSTATLTTFPHNFDKPFPSFRKPQEIGCFSLDKDRTFKDDNSQLRYYYLPNTSDIKFDLRNGYNNWIKRDESVKEYIDELLRWILKHTDRFYVPNQDNKNFRLNTDFVCWRGLLTRLLCTPYENRDGWIISVILFKGTYYMCEFDTESKKKERFHSSDRQNEMSYWGYKFEQYVCTGKRAEQPNTRLPVNTNEAYCTVVRTRLNLHSLVFAGEVDCCDDNKQYVELKTSRQIDSARQNKNFKRFKLIKWWAQSFLPNVPTVRCGFRDDDGIVREIQTYRTTDIPNIAKDIPDAWKPNVCFNFCDRFLEFVKSTVTVDDHRVAHVFSWNPTEPVKWKQYPPNSDYCFLPEWYFGDKL